MKLIPFRKIVEMALIFALICVLQSSAFGAAPNPPTLSSPGTVPVDFVVTSGNPEYLKLPRANVFQPHQIVEAKAAARGQANLRSFAISYKAWHLVGEFVYNPGFFYEINPDRLVGPAGPVVFEYISKYPDLAKRYKSIRPTSVNFIIQGGVRVRNGNSTETETVFFKVTDNDLVYFESRSPKNYSTPTSPLKWQDRFSEYLRPLDPNQIYISQKWNTLPPVFHDEKYLRNLFSRIVEVFAINEVLLDIKWPDAEIAKINELYEKYEKEGKKLEEDFSVTKAGYKLPKPISPYHQGGQAAEPYEDTPRNAEVFEDKVDSTIGIRTKSKFLITYPSRDNSLRKIRNTKYFIHGRSGTFAIVDARGREQVIDGKTSFSSINSDESSGEIQLEIRERGRDAIERVRNGYFRVDINKVHSTRSSAIAEIRRTARAAAAEREREIAQEVERRRSNPVRDTTPKITIGIPESRLYVDRVEIVTVNAALKLKEKTDGFMVRIW